jgi:hypothetical protein
MEIQVIAQTNSTAEDAISSAGIKALRPEAVIHHKIRHRPNNSRSDQSAKGAFCRSCLPTVTATFRQQCRDVRSFLERIWIANHFAELMPCLLPDS